MAKFQALFLLMALLIATLAEDPISSSANAPETLANLAEAPEIEMYEFTPEEAPGSPVSVCLTKLTYDCAEQINIATVGKALNLTVPCCNLAIRIGKTCWDYILNEPMDDPCHFFHYVMAHCLKLTKTKNKELFEFHFNQRKPCMGKEALEVLEKTRAGHVQEDEIEAGKGLWCRMAVVPGNQSWNYLLKFSSLMQINKR